MTPTPGCCKKCWNSKFALHPRNESKRVETGCGLSCECHLRHLPTDSVISTHTKFCECERSDIDYSTLTCRTCTLSIRPTTGDGLDEYCSRMGSFGCCCRACHKKIIELSRTTGDVEKRFDERFLKTYTNLADALREQISLKDVKDFLLTELSRARQEATAEERQRITRVAEGMKVKKNFYSVECAGCRRRTELCQCEGHNAALSDIIKAINE